MIPRPAHHPALEPEFGDSVRAPTEPFEPVAAQLRLNFRLDWSGPNLDESGHAI